MSDKLNRPLIFSVIVLGISTIITQIILLREFLSVFYGNELVMGIILANWMLITGFGAYSGKFFDRITNKIRLVSILLFLMSLLPIITVFLLNFLRNIVFPIGSMISIIDVLYSSFILLLPVCLVSGLLFTVLCNVISERKEKNMISRVYSLEAIGAIIGGLIFNLILLYIFKTFECLIILLIINVIAVHSIYRSQINKYISVIILIISAALIVFAFRLNLDSSAKEYLYKDQNIIYQKDTPYGNIVITETGGQKNFFENGQPLFSTNNSIENEEDVHYAMLQHPDPKNILLISGGISGTTNEILKYDIDKLYYAEINPWIFKTGKEFTETLSDKKINLINKDARLYIKETDNTFDIVLINLPEPNTAQINRFYTVEFFKELKRRLSKNAVISIRLFSTINYVSDKARKTNSVLYNTLKHCFENVLIIPGGKNYYLASDTILSINISHKVQESGIENIYVNQYYIQDDILKQRSEYILNELDKNAAINKDFTPVAYYMQLQHWLSYFKINYWIIAMGFFLALVLIIFRYNIINLGLFTSGFAASSTEVILLISFQIIYGFVYQMIGIIITLFMAGLAFGALYLTKKIKTININKYIKIQFGISIYLLVLPFVLLLLKSYSINLVLIHGVFFVLTLIIGSLIGLLYSVASKIQSKKISLIAAETYSADLLGSAIGALLISAILIPVFGIIKVCLIISVLNFTYVLFISFRRGKIVSLST